MRILNLGRLLPFGQFSFLRYSPRFHQSSIFPVCIFVTISALALFLLESVLMPLSVSLVSELESRIASRQARIGVIGMGYVGLPLTLLFSEQRFRVTGFDVDASKVEALNAGGSYIVRIPAPEIAKAQAAR